MEPSMDCFRLSLAFSPLVDIVVIIGIIGALGFFLWNKGRFTMTTKR